MGFFTVTQKALAAGRTVFFARLVRLQFDSATSRLWDGFGPLTVDGDTYDGAGELGSVGEIPFGLNDQAGNVQFALSGVDDEIVALAQTEMPVRGTPVTVWGQFLSEALQPTDSKFVLFEGELDVLSFSGRGPSERRIQATAEGIWTGRRGAAFALYSDRDQKARFPGDRGCAFLPSLKNKRVTWPKFLD